MYLHVCAHVCVCKKHKSMYRLQFKCLDPFRAEGTVALEGSGEAMPSSGHAQVQLQESCLARPAPGLERKRPLPPACWQSNCMLLPIMGICISVPGAGLIPPWFFMVDLIWFLPSLCFSHSLSWPMQ